MTPRPQGEKARSYGKVARSGVLWSYMRLGVFSAVQIPSTILLARLLSPADFGIAAAAQYFGQLAVRLTGAGMGAALVRARQLEREHVSSVFVLNGTFNLAAFLALWLCAPAIGAFYRSEAIAQVMPVVAMTFLTGAIATVPTSLLQRDMKFRETAILGAVESVVTATGSIALAMLGFGFWSLIYGDLAGAASRSLAAVWYARWKPSLRFSRAAAADMMSFGVGSWAKRLLDHATLNLDNVVIGRFLGVQALGLYDKGFTVMNRVVNQINVGGPVISFRIFSVIQDEPERFRRAYRKVIVTVTMVAYPLLATLAVGADRLFLLAFGARWVPAVLPFRILCIVGMLKVVNLYASSAAQAKGWIWSEVWRQIVYATTIVIGVYAARGWGINGAAVAVSLAAILMFVMMQSMLRQATGLAWSDLLGPQRPALICSALIVLAALGVGELALMAGGNDWMALGAQLATAGIVYVLFVRSGRFAELHAVVVEMLEDWAPGLLRFLAEPPSAKTTAATPTTPSAAR